MERERGEFDSCDLAGIWRNAEQRRADDIGAWLRRIIERRRQKISEIDAAYQRGKRGTEVKATNGSLFDFDRSRR
jgi:hypothetical protein